MTYKRTDAASKLADALGRALESEANDFAEQAAANPHNFSSDKLTPTNSPQTHDHSKRSHGIHVALAAAAACALLGVGFAGGSLSSHNSPLGKSAANDLTSSNNTYEEELAYDTDNSSVASFAESANSSIEAAFPGVSSNGTSSESYAKSERKLITSYSINAESTSFDSDISSIEQLTQSLGGYVESSSLNTASVDENLRSITYVLRIPTDKATELVSSVSDTLNITYMGTDTTDVTLDYYDSEARLESYRTELETLQRLMKEAEQISDVIEIESRISEVNYNVDYYESILKNYDNRIDNTTVSLYVKEVSHVTEKTSASVWARISSGFSASLSAFRRAVTDAFVWIASNIVWLAAAAAIIIAIVLIVRRLSRKQ